MRVKCIKKCRCGSEEKQITVGFEYIVLEVMFCKDKSDVDLYKSSYRILNNAGIPCVYDAAYFEIISYNLENMSAESGAFGFIITHKLIADTELKNKNVNGFWAYLFETEAQEAIDLLYEVVSDINKNENLLLPPIFLS